LSGAPAITEQRIGGSPSEYVSVQSDECVIAAQDAGGQHSSADVRQATSAWTSWPRKGAAGHGVQPVVTTWDDSFSRSNHEAPRSAWENRNSRSSHVRRRFPRDSAVELLWAARGVRLQRVPAVPPRPPGLTES